MILEIADWIFDVNIPTTMEYSAHIAEDPCQCGYCRNFRQTVDDVYPQLKSFLKQFGMNSLTPEEMSPIEPTLCMGSYCISGSVVKRGIYPIDLGSVVLSVPEQADPLYSPSCGVPFFVFDSGLLDLPWVLDEDMDEVLSPANEPEYMERMMNRLLENAGDDIVIS